MKTILAILTVCLVAATAQAQQLQRLEIGNVIESRPSWEVQQKMSDSEALVSLPIHRLGMMTTRSGFTVPSGVLEVSSRYSVYAKGFDFSRSVDGSQFPYRGFVRATGSHTYVDTLGARRTVLVIEPAPDADEANVGPSWGRPRERPGGGRTIGDKPALRRDEGPGGGLNNLPTVRPIAKTEPRMGPMIRRWRDSTRKYSVQGRYISFKNSKVLILKEDGSWVVIPVSKLSGEDQKYVRETSKLTWEQLQRQVITEPDAQEAESSVVVER